MRPNSSLAAVIVAATLTITGCSGPPPPPRVFIDPGLAPLIPPDTNVLAGVRVDLLSKHPAFPLIVKQRAVQSFVETSRIKPKDLWQVMFVSNGRDSFWTARGKFANELMAPDPNRYGYAGGRFDYKGLSMVGNEAEALMFINSTTTAVGPAPVLRALIDARGQMKDVPARFAPLLSQIPLESEVWGAYAGGPVDLDLPGNFANLRNVFALLQSGTFYMNANTGLHLVASGTSPSEASAQQLHDALQGLFALGQLTGQQIKAEVTREGTHVTVKADAGF